jgi:hypothetical protein
LRKHRAALLSKRLFQTTPTWIAMKTKAIACRPRNPLVAAALLRKAGAHRRSPSGVRQRSRTALQREVQAAARKDDWD